MKVGVDTFTLHPIKFADTFALLDCVKKQDLAGALLPGVRGLSPTLDPGKLREIRQHADRLGLYSHVSVSSPNAQVHKPAKTPDDLAATLTAEIEAATRAGWHELHTTCGEFAHRYSASPTLRQQIAAITATIQRLAPVLRANNSRINLEDHADLSTFEIVRLAEDCGPDILGCCLDFANTLCQAEDPLAAVRRIAPYTHLTHAKDAIIYFSDRGYTRQGRPPGQGIIPWEQALPILHHFSPNLELSIEDHKWLFEMPVFEPDWHAHNPDLSPAEFARVMQLAWQCQKRIAAGDFPDPATYEAIPFVDQFLERLHSGRDYLRSVITRLNLSPN